MVDMANIPSSGRILLLAALFLPVSVWASDWSFNPYLTVSERYSDNVSLASSGTESSFVTEITPGFSLKKKGGRGELSVDYGLQTLLYSNDSGANTTNNQLSATLKSELIQEHFYLDANARISQQNTNQLGRIGASNYNTTGNLTETRSASVTPSWRSRFGNTAQLDARWQLSYTDSSGGIISGTTGNALSVNLQSGSAFPRTPWSLAYSLHNSDNSSSSFSSLTGTLGYILSHRTRFHLSVGTDSNNGNTTGFNQASGTFWNVGVDWTPSIRTSLGATVGHRFNGDSYGLNLTQRTRKATFALRYNESLSDVYSQITATGAYDLYICSDGRVLPVPAGTPLSDATCSPSGVIPAVPVSSLQLVNSVSLNKTWSGTASYRAGKSNFSLNLNKTRRELLNTTVGTVDDTYSLGGSWTLRIGPRTHSTLSLTTTHAKADASQTDYWTLAWLLSHQLSQKTTGTLELRRVEGDSAVAPAGSYTENSILARLHMTF